MLETEAYPDDHEALYAQVKRLAYAILELPLGEPSRSEGAIDCAIRLLRELALLRPVAPAIGPWADEARERGLL